jgi:hypothetical protein
MPDWEAIKKDFEDGLSLRTLSAKYDVGKSTIADRSNAGHWQRTEPGHIPDIPYTPLPEQDTEIAGLAKQMVGQLATIAQTPLELKEHKLFADSLSQYHKIILTSVDAQSSTPQSLDWSIFTEAELAIIQPIFAQAEERKRIELGETTIPQLRKI